MSVSSTRFLGGLMMAVGGMMAVLCGLCTGISEIGFLMEGLETGNYVMPFIFGLPPTLIGVGLFFWGRAVLRRASKANPP